MYSNQDVWRDVPQMVWRSEMIIEISHMCWCFWGTQHSGCHCPVSLHACDSSHYLGVRCNVWNHNITQLTIYFHNTCMWGCLVPWNILVSCPFMLSNGKQEVAHNGPRFLTASVRCSSMCTHGRQYRSPRWWKKVLSVPQYWHACLIHIP